jgi:hypothetical protein
VIEEGVTIKSGPLMLRLETPNLYSRVSYKIWLKWGRACPKMVTYSASFSSPSPFPPSSVSFSCVLRHNIKSLLLSLHLRVCFWEIRTVIWLCPWERHGSRNYKIKCMSAIEPCAVKKWCRSSAASWRSLKTGLRKYLSWDNNSKNWLDTLECLALLKYLACVMSEFLAH